MLQYESRTEYRYVLRDGDDQVESRMKMHGGTELKVLPSNTDPYWQLAPSLVVSIPPLG